MEAQARQISKSVTFADLDRQALYSDDVTWPTSALPKAQAKLEFRYALALIRTLKGHMREIAAKGDATALRAWRKHRALHTIQAYIARERFHRPEAFTGLRK